MDQKLLKTSHFPILVENRPFMLLGLQKWVNETFLVIFSPLCHNRTYHRKEIYFCGLLLLLNKGCPKKVLKSSFLVQSKLPGALKIYKRERRSISFHFVHFSPLHKVERQSRTVSSSGNQIFNLKIPFWVLLDTYL